MHYLGISSLDAPVSGGDVGAREARLSIMVGGDQPVFDRVEPCFNAMGKSVVRMASISILHLYHVQLP